MPLEIASTNEQEVPITASPVTASGNPAQIQGALRVSVQSGDATFRQDAATPLEFVAVSGANQGTSTYLVEADADLGEGEVLIQDVVTYEVSGAMAASFDLSAGPARPKQV